MSHGARRAVKQAGPLKVACAKRLHTGGHGPSGELQNVGKANRGFAVFSAWHFGEIPAKFRWNLAKFEQFQISAELWKKLASFLLKFWVQSGAKGWKSCRNIWFSLFFSPAPPRRPQTTHRPGNLVSLLENRHFEKCMFKYFFHLIEKLGKIG